VVVRVAVDVEQRITRGRGEQVEPLVHAPLAHVHHALQHDESLAVPPSARSFLGEREDVPTPDRS
jgi:hypothetical protein